MQQGWGEGGPTLTDSAQTVLIAFSPTSIERPKQYPPAPIDRSRHPRLVPSSARAETSGRTDDKLPEQQQGEHTGIEPQYPTRFDECAAASDE